jgi:hypothetical protein
MVEKKKCSDCGAPLEGLLYNTLGKIFGIKPSESNSKICNKCESDAKKKPKTETKNSKPAVKEIENTKEEEKIKSKTAQQLLNDLGEEDDNEEGEENGKDNS